jgi:antitoxin component YwqK of YwqJK toxin-antitoxin module
MRDLMQRDGIYYKKSSDVPSTGEVAEPHKGLITNGKKEGAWIRYYVSGQLHYKGNYKNGKMEGAWVVYSGSGIPYKLKTGTFKNGVKISV